MTPIRPTAAYHNYFHSYDAERQIMVLADGTAAMGGHTGAASCGITCTPSTKSGGRELSYYVMDIPTTTPVIDVSGEEHGLKTLQVGDNAPRVQTVKMLADYLK